MMFFELRRGSSTLLRKATSGVPIFLRGAGVKHFAPQSRLQRPRFSSGCRDLNLRRTTSSEKAVCAYQLPTLHFVQRGRWCRQLFRSFPKEKRFPFLHGRLLSFPLVSQHTPCFFAFGYSLLLPPAAVAPKAPGTRRSHSLNKKTPCFQGLLHKKTKIVQILKSNGCFLLKPAVAVPLKKRKAKMMFS